MDQLKPATLNIPSWGQFLAQHKKNFIAIKGSFSKKDKAFLDNLYRSTKASYAYKNSTYTVLVNKNPDTLNDILVTPEYKGKFTYLSVRRNDREPIVSWEDMQEIKNALVGKECEGYELFPAENRVMDAANQYHLWILKDANESLPFSLKKDYIFTADTSYTIDNYKVFQEEDLLNNNHYSNKNIEEYSHLIIKGHNNVHDWRELQKIKNKIAGSNKEGYGLFPAESKRLKEEKGYHLWIHKKEGSFPPISFLSGGKGDNATATLTGAKQRD